MRRGSRQTVLLARRTRTMKQCSFDARSKEQSAYSLWRSCGIRRLLLDARTSEWARRSQKVQCPCFLALKLRRLHKLFQQEVALELVCSEEMGLLWSIDYRSDEMQPHKKSRDNTFIVFAACAKSFLVVTCKTMRRQTSLLLQRHSGRLELKSHGCSRLMGNQKMLSRALRQQRRQ